MHAETDYITFWTRSAASSYCDLEYNAIRERQQLSSGPLWVDGVMLAPWFPWLAKNGPSTEEFCGLRWLYSMMPKQVRLVTKSGPRNLEIKVGN